MRAGNDSDGPVDGQQRPQDEGPLQVAPPTQLEQDIAAVREMRAQRVAPSTRQQYVSKSVRFLSYIRTTYPVYYRWPRAATKDTLAFGEIRRDSPPLDFAAIPAEVLVAWAMSLDHKGKKLNSQTVMGYISALRWLWSEYGQSALWSSSRPSLRT